MKVTEAQINKVAARERLNREIIRLWLMFSEKSEKFLTDEDATLFAAITVHPAIQDKLK